MSVPPLSIANSPGPVNSAGWFGYKVKPTKPVPGRTKLAATGAGTPKRRIVWFEPIESVIGSQDDLGVDGPVCHPIVGEQDGV